MYLAASRNHFQEGKTVIDTTSTFNMLLIKSTN